MHRLPRTRDEDVPAAPPLREAARGRLRRATVAAAVAILALVPFAPIAILGIPAAHDLPDHAAMASQLLAGLAEGRSYPRWCGDFSRGWGDATGQYYPPGLYYLTAATSSAIGLLPGSSGRPEDERVILGLFAALGVLTLVGMAGTYRLVRPLAGPGAALVACAALSVAPYRYVELCHAGLLSAYAAGCLVPWLLVAIVRTAENPWWPRARSFTRPAAGYAVAWALIALTNLPTLVIVTYLSGAWAILEGIARRSWRIPCRVALGGALGALMASAYLLPVVLELRCIQPAIPNDHLLFRSNFVFQGAGFWNPSLGDLLSWVAAVQIGVLVVSLGAAARWARAGGQGDPSEARGAWTRALAVFGLGAAFLATPLSWILWERLPFLKRLYMPWRLLDPLAACGAALAGVAVVALLRKGGGRAALPRPFRAVAASALVALGTAALSLSWTAATRNGQVPRDEYPLVARSFYERRSFHLPLGAGDPDRLAGAPPVGILTPGASAEILGWSTSRRELRVVAQGPATIALRTFWFPGWQARDLSAPGSPPLPVRAERDTGAILVDVPAGDRRILVSFEATAPRTAGALVAALAWLAWVGLRFAPGRAISGRRSAAPFAVRSARARAREEVLA